MKSLLANLKLEVFTLWDELKNIIQKEKNRKNRFPLNDRVTECYNILRRNIKDMNTVIIDNSKDIDRKVNQIKEKL